MSARRHRPARPGIDIDGGRARHAGTGCSADGSIPGTPVPTSLGGKITRHDTPSSTGGLPLERPQQVGEDSVIGDLQPGRRGPGAPVPVRVHARPRHPSTHRGIEAALRHRLERAPTRQSTAEHVPKPEGGGDRVVRADRHGRIPQQRLEKVECGAHPDGHRLGRRGTERDRAGRGDRCTSTSGAASPRAPDLAT